MLYRPKVNCDLFDKLVNVLIRFTFEILSGAVLTSAELENDVVVGHSTLIVFKV